MARKIPMGDKDLLRVTLLEQVKQGHMSLSAAAQKLGLSYRQAKRIRARYASGGAAGIVHKLSGKKSNNRLSEELKAKILELYRTRYEGFGPTFAREKLSALDDIQISRESLRQLLILEGLWERKKRRRGYHARRRPRERFGELVQFDGSHHDWFEGRGPRCCLMNMVDDATGTTLSFLCEQETTEAAMRLLWTWIERYGIPQAVYCDRKNAFVLDRDPTIAEQLKGIIPRSPFETACYRLGIEVIVARSPEAKGRVERNHAVYQDRFVKELRLAGISTMEAANGYLEKEYLPTINERFARPPEKKEDAHVPLGRIDLNDVFCREEERTVSRDHILQVGRKYFKVPKDLTPRPRPGTRVIMRRWLDNSIHFYWNGRPLLVEEYEPRDAQRGDPAILSA